MNSFNVYKCQKCGEYYHIPCLFVQDAKKKGEEDLCPKCKNHSGKLDKADVYRGIHDDYLKRIGKWFLLCVGGIKLLLLTEPRIYVVFYGLQKNISVFMC